MSTQAVDKLIFRDTNSHTGRKVAISPDNSSMRHLAYGRIILNALQPSGTFETGDRETGLICLGGEAQVHIGSHSTHLGRYDAIYVPRDSTVELTTASAVDIAEFSADVAKRYPLQVVRCAEISQDPKLKYTTGGASCTRQLHMLLAKNIEAGRLMAGITHSDSGNWTSWPPHEHGAMLEEIYVYFDMPHPAYGVQLVYRDTDSPEMAAVVRDGDAVVIPGGYHPNVAIPGHQIAFLWALAAHREGEDRQFGVVNVQPDFQPSGASVDAGRKKRD